MKGCICHLVKWQIQRNDLMWWIVREIRVSLLYIHVHSDNEFIIIIQLLTLITLHSKYHWQLNSRPWKENIIMHIGLFEITQIALDIELGFQNAPSFYCGYSCMYWSKEIILFTTNYTCFKYSSFGVLDAVVSMLALCWLSVVDGEPTLNQHWHNISCSLGCPPH